MKISENILNLLENLNLIELNELINSLEKKYNISKSTNLNTEEENENKNLKKKIKFSVYLEEVGKNKVSIIKIIKEINNLGLKEAKDLVESSPVLVKSGLEEKDAENLKIKLVEAGSKVTIKKNE